MSTCTVAIHGCALQTPAKSAAYRPALFQADTGQHLNTVPHSWGTAAGILNWLKQKYHRYQTNKRRRASYRVMASLPDSILSDIGWPNIVDQLDRQETSHK